MNANLMILDPSRYRIKCTSEEDEMNDEQVWSRRVGWVTLKEATYYLVVSKS